MGRATRRYAPVAGPTARGLIAPVLFLAFGASAAPDAAQPATTIASWSLAQESDTESTSPATDITDPARSGTDTSMSTVTSGTVQLASAEEGNPPTLGTGPAPQGSWVVTPRDPSLPSFTADPDNTNYAPAGSVVSPAGGWLSDDGTGQSPLNPGLNRHKGTDGDFTDIITPGPLPGPSDFSPEDVDDIIDRQLDIKQVEPPHVDPPLPQQQEVAVAQLSEDAPAPDEEVTAADPPGDEDPAPQDGDPADPGVTDPDAPTGDAPTGDAPTGDADTGSPGAGDTASGQPGGDDAGGSAAAGGPGDGAPAGNDGGDTAGAGGIGGNGDASGGTGQGGGDGGSGGDGSSG